MRRLTALLIVLAGNPQGEQATFRVHDRLDTNEIEETTSLYIDRELVRIIHLDATHPYEVVTIAVAGGSAPIYALCGSVTVRALDGNPETHEVDGSGILTDVAGRDFDAVAAQDFTLFFLTDITEGRLPADVQINRARSCAEPVS